MAGRDVQVVFTKYDGSLHWHFTNRYLGEDEYGIWLGGPAGQPVQRGSEPPVQNRTRHVALVPAGAWWFASFYSEPQETEVYCDIATPPSWPHPGEVTMVDLDLDVWRGRDQRVRILDEDEFAEHQVRYGYPPDVIRQAEAAAAELQAAVSAHAEPFGTHYLHWLELVD